MIISDDIILFIESDFRSEWMERKQSWKACWTLLKSFGWNHNFAFKVENEAEVICDFEILEVEEESDEFQLNLDLAPWN